MAMSTCTECGGELSTKARACPKCGAVVPKPKVWPWIVGVPIALIAALLISGANTPDYVHYARELREACEKIAPHEKVECRRIHDQSIAEGKRLGKK